MTTTNGPAAVQVTGTIFAAANAEAAMVGALLNNPNQIELVTKDLCVSDLTDPFTQRVFEMMVELWSKGSVPDHAAVMDEMIARGTLDAEDSHRIVTLMARTPTVYPERYIPAILDRSLRMKMRGTLKDADALAQDPTVTGEDALDRTVEMLSSIDRPSTDVEELPDIGTFCAGEDSFDWLVPGLFERQDRMLLVAPESVGKSMFQRQVAVCCAAGIHPFTLRPEKPISVLLLDCENPEAMGRRKLRPMWIQARQMRPQVDPTYLRIACRPGGIDVARRSDARWLTAQVTAIRPDLVVAGPLYKLFEADDKWEQGARAVASVFDDLRSRIGFALILETHAPQDFQGKRTMRPIGSTLWRRWPEFGMSFVPTDTNPDVVKVTMWKDRDERCWPKYLKKGGAFPWTPCADPSGALGGGSLYTPGPPPPRYDQEDF